VTAQFKFDVKSAEQSRERGASEAEAEQPEKKHRSFFRRKKETK
jgi:hypothetical protein